MEEKKNIAHRVSSCAIWRRKEGLEKAAEENIMTLGYRGFRANWSFSVSNEKVG